jgi:hypothetical protein
MGWSSGGYLYDQVAGAMKTEFGDKNPKKQQRVLETLIRWLEDEDCDVLEECQGISKASDDALRACGYHIYIPGLCSWDEMGYNCRCGWSNEPF